MDHLPELTKVIQDQKLLSEVLSQIEKDLGESHANLTQLEYTDITDLIETLADILWEIHSRSKQGIFNLLYRIDLPESKVQETVSSEGFDWNLLAQLILKRELQKVILRRHFST